MNTTWEDDEEATRVASANVDLLSIRDEGPISIVQIYGPEIGRLIDIDVDGMVLGRGIDCDILINSDTVSRQHAELRWVGNTITVQDSDSLNGTYVDERRVRGPTPLEGGQSLRLGGVIFKVLRGADLERRYHEEIYRMAIIDGLTAIHNKRYFVEFLDREHGRAIRHERPLSLILFDVDNFKSLNDHHGHINGDRVLEQMASRVRSFVRRDECFARYGGEEFALILPESPVRGAVALAEKIRIAVEETPFRLEDDQDISVTVSLGVAMLRANETVQGLISRADEALYEAKGAGRNNVRQWASAGDSSE
ncbi:MAG: GGDEF domain-containing protein [Myxococcota bacterium]|nr:GGDEF domain-containing protein [Myxococcales bacterium]MEC7752297.1 GGDEF domain-containing protein [Myxococcota bacterium]